MLVKNDITTLWKANINSVTVQLLVGLGDIRTTEIHCNVSDEEKVRAV